MIFVWATAAACGLGLQTASAAASPPRQVSHFNPPLVQLANGHFGNLTRAERVLLEYSDASNTARGDFAAAGPSADPLDPSNDPAHADEWSHDRDIRAELIRWLAVDHAAATLVDPNGVRVLGARIIGKIDLAHIRVPFAIALVRCSIPGRMNLESVDIPYLDLRGSHTGSVHALNLTVHGDLSLGESIGQNRGGFDASGLVNLLGAKIEGIANFSGGHFRYAEDSSQPWADPQKLALLISDAEIKGDVSLGSGFESQGCAFVAENTIGGDLNCFGGRFINPGNAALEAGGNDIKGTVFLGPNPGFFPSLGFEADGLVMFENTRVAASFFVQRAKFGGRASERHGFFASGLSVRRALIWQEVHLENSAIVDLSGANIDYLIDQERSWPSPGRLLIDGLAYRGFTAGSYSADWTSPVDARSRLRWLALQPGFHPQTYRQLAKVLAENGDDVGAMRVRIAADDLRYSQHGIFGGLLGGFLKYTIGYGHQPLLALYWSGAVVVLGWLIVWIAARAGVMAPTWPENAPPHAKKPYERLQPLLYSLDVFLPFVNLHQEHYWWPDSSASGECAVLGRTIRVKGWALRCYLWVQIIAGWLLSAIFVAGVTGLMRND